MNVLDCLPIEIALIVYRYLFDNRYRYLLIEYYATFVQRKMVDSAGNIHWDGNQNKFLVLRLGRLAGTSTDFLYSAYLFDNRGVINLRNETSIRNIYSGKHVCSVPKRK